jgi:hypothetical protein
MQHLVIWQIGDSVSEEMVASFCRALLSLRCYIAGYEIEEIKIKLRECLLTGNSEDLKVEGLKNTKTVKFIRFVRMLFTVCHLKRMHIFKKSEKLLRGYLLLKSLNYE